MIRLFNSKKLFLTNKSTLTRSSSISLHRSIPSFVGEFKIFPNISDTSSFSSSNNLFTSPSSLSFYLNGKENKKGLIILDSGGLENNRMKEIADYFSAQGYFTIVPDIKPIGFTNSSDISVEEFSKLPKNMKILAYEGNIHPKISEIVGFMHHHEVNSIGLLGFNWGSWVAVNALASPLSKEFDCAALPHLKFDAKETKIGGDLVNLMEKIKKPILLMPYQDDSSEIKSLAKLIQSKLPVSDLVTLKSLQNSLLSKDNNKDLQTILTFFNNHVHLKDNVVSFTLDSSSQMGPPSLKNLNMIQLKKIKDLVQANGFMHLISTMKSAKDFLLSDYDILKKNYLFKKKVMEKKLNNAKVKGQEYYYTIEEGYENIKENCNILAKSIQEMKFGLPNMKNEADLYPSSFLDIDGPVKKRVNNIKEKLNTLKEDLYSKSKMRKISANSEELKSTEQRKIESKVMEPTVASTASAVKIDRVVASKLEDTHSPTKSDQMYSGVDPDLLSKLVENEKVSMKMERKKETPISSKIKEPDYLIKDFGLEVNEKSKQFAHELEKQRELDEEMLKNYYEKELQKGIYHHENLEELYSHYKGPMTKEEFMKYHQKVEDIAFEPPENITAEVEEKQGISDNLEGQKTKLKFRDFHFLKSAPKLGDLYDKIKGKVSYPGEKKVEDEEGKEISSEGGTKEDLIAIKKLEEKTKAKGT